MAQIKLRDYLQETEDALGSDRIDDALANCQYILAYFPESLEAQRLLGEIYLAQGRLEDAQHAFDWVLTNDPENVLAYCNRALVSERLSDYDTALDCYQQAYELSRGNSQIRQKFNQLSASIGQQGFMFSRAGLARLYMRGDLLRQAMQEWETVLAASPDRLDARTGLLETYWLESQSEQVEQLALQILEDVPGCLKALLLLAHVTLPKGMPQAQEYLQKAQAMDPDLMLAQDLFSDLIARKVPDPFLRMLQIPPTMIATIAPTENASRTPAYMSNNEAVQNIPVEIADPLRSDTTLVAPWRANTEQKSAEPEPWQLLQEALHSIDSTAASTQNQSVSEYALWNSLVPLEQDSLSTSSSWENLQEVAPEETANSWSVSTQEADTQHGPPPWLSMLTQADRRQMTGPTPAIPPVELNNLSAPVQPSTEIKPASPVVPPAELKPATPVKVEPPVQSARSQWDEQEDTNSIQDEGLMFGPEWLKSLGATSLELEVPGHAVAEQQNEVPPKPIVQPSMQEQMPEQQSTPGTSQYVEEQQSIANPWLSQLLEQPQQPAANAQQSLSMQETWQSRQSGQLDQQPVANAWLAQFSEQQQQPPANAQQSLSMQNVWQPQSSEQRPAHEQETWLSQLSNTTQSAQESWKKTPEPPQEPSWLAQLSGTNQNSEHPWLSQGMTTPADIAPIPDENAEQNLLATLEEVEKDLRSKGFISLEPNSLSTLANQQANPVESPVQEQRQREEEHVQETNQSSALSSALAELGNFAAQAPPRSALPTPVNPLAEPSWVTDLRAKSAPQGAADNTVLQELEMRTNTFNLQNQKAQDPIEEIPAPPTNPLAQKERAPEPVFESLPVPPKNVSQEATKTPALQANPFDGELETTMKRPAVRLQPLHQRATASREQMITFGKGRLGEREGGKPATGDLSNKDRLLKGYQSQLVGDYDDAMQEYRIIIRTAPELLGEVVSNMRALLKLAPQYSVGYRVLGDAYMRQGEYLQAMESYNKALTMAKKSKN